jgi:structural maintenance of chromosome 4
VPPAGEDGYSAVPHSQFVVTRTAFRNDTSAYYINDKKSTMVDVTTLLKGRGIDLDHNRFLILQGEVESIAMMKPKAAAPGEEGLLEYLEDIIGSAAYVERIAEAEKVTEALSGARGEKLARVKVVERERASLESAKAEAHALLSKERELLRSQGLLAAKQLADATEAAAPLTARHERAATKRADAGARLAEFEGGLAGLRGAAEQAQAAADAAGAAARAHKERFRALEKRDLAVRACAGGGSAGGGGLGERRRARVERTRCTR